MTNVLIKDKIKRVLIMVPKNVIQNWAHEFNLWFDECQITNDVNIFPLLFEKKPHQRVSYLKMWQEKGGIMLITISLFRKLIMDMMEKPRTTANNCIRECLLNPGPDMVVVDEGHFLKNEDSKFHECVSQIRTHRRIILTGTPMQNNLSEYFTMVDFVKPNLLGTKEEFNNRFANPINNGKYANSTPYDVQNMKECAYVLNTLLEKSINRCGYQVLINDLQPKLEYVLSLRLTETQANLYRHYIFKLVDRSFGYGENLLHDHTILGYIWNHPALLDEDFKRTLKERKNEEDNQSSNSMDDFLVNSDNDSNKSDHSDIESTDENVSKIINDWHLQFMPEEYYQIELSIKFQLLFSILEKCEAIGDKIVIFSQYCNTLNLIEHFLSIKMKEYNDKYGSELSYDQLVCKTGGVSNRWIKGTDYFRIDGKVNCKIRDNSVKKLNDAQNHRARLMLISTLAGGVGINLVGANRCIIFDVSWNPSNDTQAIFRIFRYGQTKPVYVYRFTTAGKSHILLFSSIYNL